MTELTQKAEHARDVRAVGWFLVAVAIAAIILGWLWFAQRELAEPAPMTANQPADVGLVQGNTGGGTGF